MTAGEGAERLAGARSAYLKQVRADVLAEVARWIPSGGDLDPVLYDLVRDYPFRAAKSLRPALAIATCRALGGSLETVLPSAASLELYHNAFLIHDDVEDGSLLRRDEPTLQAKYGVPIAVNVGDAMLALALRPLLDNTRTAGLGPALRVLEVVVEMSRESAEGQAIELDWIRHRAWDVDEAAYLRMVHKKTTWYSFLAPVEIGAILAGVDDGVREALKAFATALGAAFQVRDDVLNIAGATHLVGKEHAGDLWEGKRTLLVLHALSCATARERERAVMLLDRARPGPGAQGVVKTEEDVAYVLSLLDRYGSVAHASARADAFAGQASAALSALSTVLPSSPHRTFLQSLVSFVVERPS